MLQVIKRDGRTVAFDPSFIEAAIAKAYFATGQDDPTKALAIANIAAEEAHKRFDDNIAIYELQAIVEQALLNSGDHEVAEAYIDYRKSRDIERAKTLDIGANVDKLISKDSDIVNENANKDGRVFHTLRDFTAGTTAKAVGLKMLPKHVANAHLKGQIHFHDLDYMPFAPYTNCCLPDFENMLKNGYKMGNADIESPKSIGTAAAQVSQLIANISSAQYGGVSVDRIDELLAPYALLDREKATEQADKWIDDPDKKAEFVNETVKKNIYNAMQALEYEINTLQTSNGQLAA